MNNNSLENKQHFYWLDLIRFLAAFEVVLCHYRGFFFVEYGLLPAEQQNIFSQIFYFATRLGHEAVLIFFVLSGLLVGGKALDKARLGTFNLHGSLLPQYRGAAPINWALINGDTTTGVTTFMLKHEIDTGNIIMQESTPIDENENVGSVYDRLMQIGQTLVTRTVDLIIESDSNNTPLPTLPQIETNELRPAPKLFKDTCEIHFDQMSATQVKNFVRGLSPYPAAWANITIAGQAFENVKIHAVEVLDDSYITSKKDIIVRCKEGLVRILELQAPGKKRMDAKAFLNGLH